MMLCKPRLELILRLPNAIPAGGSDQRISAPPALSRPFRERRSCGRFRRALLLACVGALAAGAGAPVWAAMPASERQVLLNLYVSTNGATCVDNSRWSGGAEYSSGGSLRTPMTLHSRRCPKTPLRSIRRSCLASPPARRAAPGPGVGVSNPHPISYPLVSTSGCLLVVAEVSQGANDANYPTCVRH